MGTDIAAPGDGRTPLLKRHTIRMRGRLFHLSLLQVRSLLRPGTGALRTKKKPPRRGGFVKNTKDLA
jgi:hypothetical protein